MGRIESTRRHGPFDPRFAARGLRVALAPMRTAFEQRPAPAIRRERLAALAAWEGEGGAL